MNKNNTSLKIKVSHILKRMWVIVVIILFEFTLSEAQTLKYYDLIKDYKVYLKQAASRDDIDLFKKIVVQPNQAMFNVIAANRDSAFYSFYLATLKNSFHNDLFRFSEQFDKEWKKYLKEIENKFPASIGTKGTIYKGLSLFSSNGQVRKLNNQYFMIMGLDVEAYVKGTSKDLKCTFQHEYFHLIHANKNPEVYEQINNSFTSSINAPLFLQLFCEGIASYFPKYLDQDLPVSYALHNDTLESIVKPKLQIVSKAMLNEFESTDKDTQYRYFSMRHAKDRDELPDRTGYYVGYRIIEEAIKEGYSLDKLLMLSTTEIRIFTKTMLEKIADKN